MRSASGMTHRTNRESERDAHRVRNTDLEETYDAPNTLAQKLHLERHNERIRTAKTRDLEDVAEHEGRRRTRARESVEESARLRVANATSAAPFSVLSKPIQENTRTASAMHSINHPNLRFLNSSHRMITAGLGMMSATGVVG